MRKRIIAIAIFALIILTACNRSIEADPSPTPATLPETSIALLPTPTGTPEPAATEGIVPYTPEFIAAECPFQLPAGQVEGETVDCGYLIVPENRAKPGLGSLRLATAIFHPTGEKKAQDSVVYLVGGPGASILELLYLSFNQVYAPVLESGRDLIMFDQRGVGRSEPALDCNNVLDLAYELMDHELDGEEVSDAQAAALFEEAFAECHQNLANTADLSAYNTISNAADVNDLRLALGLEKVNLWGASYGTRLALGVMRDYPGGIRSVVLDSTYPLDVDLFVDTPANADRSFNRLFDSCAADAACSNAYPDLREVFSAAVDDLNQNPADLVYANPITGERFDAVFDGDEFISLLFQLLYETDIIPILPGLIYDASVGDFDDITKIQGALLIQSELSSQGMTYSVFCNEELAFSSREDFRAALEDFPYLAGSIAQSGLGEIGYSICEFWDAGEAPEAENSPVSSDLPTLIMQGEFDPITPPHWGESAAETLPNSHYFFYPGVGHGVLATECGREMLIEFILDPSTSPDDACIREMEGVQFAVPSATTVSVEMEPFTDPAKGIQGLRPVGWTEAAPGTYARVNNPLDETVLLMDAVPLDPDSLLALLSSQLDFVIEGIDAEIAESGGLTWYRYSFESGDQIIDLAAAERENETFIVMLVSSREDQPQLYDDVFDPAVRAFMSLE